MLKDAQAAVAKISGKNSKNWVKTSAFYHSLMAEQLGQVAHAYIHEGRHAKDIDEDVADVILCCLAYLNWLGEDASVAFKKSLQKHKRVIEALESKGR